MPEKCFFCDIQKGADPQRIGENNSLPHLHIHIIPRFIGDVENPRGGVRAIIPHKADYQQAAKAVGKDTYLA